MSDDLGAKVETADVVVVAAADDDDEDETLIGGGAEIEPFTAAFLCAVTQATTCHASQSCAPLSPHTWHRRDGESGCSFRNTVPLADDDIGPRTAVVEEDVFFPFGD